MLTDLCFWNILDGPSTELGATPTDRNKLDTADEWTMVYSTPMSGDGEIREFELFSGAANRGLRIGIYRPTGEECQFLLVQQKEWPSFSPGYHKVRDVFFCILTS